MGKKKTPLIQKLREIGGTLVVFPSAAEDIGLNLQATTSGVAMSHYALLNIPELAIKNCIKECDKTIDCQSDPNLAMSMSLQNYALNFETLLINQDNYNYQALSTVSEKVFWHWAMHVGILDRQKVKNIYDNYYMETGYDSSALTPDDTLIKCFGSIDAGNSLSTEFGMFNETYITIPTSWGAGPVYLKASVDDNFKNDYKYVLSDVNHLEGRDDTYKYYTYTNGQDYPFFDVKTSNTAYYQTDVSVDGLEILKDINEIQTLSQKVYGNSNIILGSYDDINIDSDNYFNVDQEFNFNAILLYYSVYDQDDLIKTAYATNLFGIIFLDGCKINTTDETFIIPTLKKRKSTTSQFGNSFSFRVNLKTMSVYDNTDAVIQDNTTTSSINAVEFSDAISNMNRAIDIMNANLHTVLNIQDQYAAILTRYDDFQQDINDLSTCINAYLKGTRSSYIDTSIVYTNDIRPSEKSSDNAINIMTRTGNTDSNGNTVYNNVVKIQDNSVYVTNLNIDNIHTNDSFINITNTSTCDKNIKAINDQYTRDTNITINKIFDSSTDMIIKVRETSTDVYNSIYIDPDSPIFNNQTLGTSLQRLLDSSKNINYMELIPFIIAKLQDLSLDVSALKNK